MYLVGIDCSTKPKNVGIALAEIGDVVQVCEVHVGITDPWDRVVNWLLTHREETILIALDAPLGWPVALGQALQDHSAGKPVDRRPDDMFRRSTDRHIKEMVGKQPLDVGADRIARTAHSALNNLNFLRESSGCEIPLAWSGDEIENVQAIEVYPAATLKSHGLRSDGYKLQDGNHRRAREEIAINLRGFRFHTDSWSRVLDNADGLDAVVCLLAAADFVRGTADPPPFHEREAAFREGWIWCRRP